MITTPGAAHFQQQWQAYRKVIDNNYLFHREIYGLLQRILEAEAAKPFHFLDIACGDASQSAAALCGSSIAHYHGIDLSGPALELAQAAVETLGCPATLEQRDFVEALNAWSEPVDVAWIGQSLHHLLAPGKLALMREIHRILGDGGLFLIWEPTQLENEDRDGWLRRFELQAQPQWSALSANEWDMVVAHNRAADFPETAAQWLSLGREAGFADGQELFAAPTNFARMYSFRKRRQQGPVCTSG